MATIKVYAYMIKPTTRSHRCLLIMYYHQAESMGPGPNWYQIENKTCFIPKVSNFYVGKRYLC